jgi:hypothetical protein
MRKQSQNSVNIDISRYDLFFDKTTAAINQHQADNRVDDNRIARVLNLLKRSHEI